jgi:cyclically-permuted mutarotase family protein
MTSCAAQKAPFTEINWTIAATLQNPDGSRSPGFAGAINAISNNVLLVAGGANFPDRMPWQGGRKYYSNEIHILEKSGDKYHWVDDLKFSLPKPIAYCGNTVTDLGVVYAGGENNDGLSKETYLLNWNANTRTVTVKPLPDLPEAMTNVGLTVINNVVYLAGGDGTDASADALYRLDLNTAAPSWETLKPLPVALANALVIAQQNKVYVIGGRSKTATGISDLHSSNYVYDPSTNQWTRLADISDGKNISNFSAGAGVSLDKDYILVTGGDNGKVFHQIETQLAHIARTTDTAEKARLTALKNNLLINHAGFDGSMLIYDIPKNQWSKVGELPFPAQVTTTACKWGDDIVLSNGEVKPGVRTPEVMIGKYN